MKSVALKFLRAVSAETIKLKKTTILWIALLGGIILAFIFFIVYWMQYDRFVPLPNENPWLGWAQLGIKNIAIFLIPFIVLITNSVVSIEHKSNAWKYLYIVPIHRGYFYVAKLITTVLLVALTYVIYFIFMLLTGYILGFSSEEMNGFHQFFPQIGEMLGAFMHSFISVLGAIGLQFWLSTKWKNYVLPIAIGITGFVASILTFNKAVATIYFPYSIPIYVALGMLFGYESEIGIREYGSFTNLELHSVLFFLFFSAIGFYQETVREVK